MRIGIDCRIFGSEFTGIGRYTFEIVTRLIKKNLEKGSPDEYVFFLTKDGFDKLQLPDSPAFKKVLVSARHYSFSEQIFFLRQLYKEQLDIIHFPHFNRPVLYRRPYIVTIHDLTLSLFPGQKMTRFYHRWAYNFVIKSAAKRAKKIIAVSNNTKKDIIHFLGIKDEKKIEVAYNGISEHFRVIENRDELLPTLKKYKIDKEFLLYTGVWRSHKNLVNLVKAFKRIRRKNLDLKLVITGKEDPHYPEVRSHIAQFELEKEVIFPGRVSEEELNHLYNAATIYVYPSLYEGFGLPPLEAMKCGTPVCASNASSIPEICGENNAVYFDPYNPKDIAEKIQTIYKDPEARAVLIANGLEHATNFSWDFPAETVYKLLHS